jgi:hypothetical protein
MDFILPLNRLPAREVILRLRDLEIGRKAYIIEIAKSLNPKISN